MTEQAINDVIKDLVAKANITTTGTIRFHLLRKFFMNALHDAGFSDWEVKRAVGKEIPTSDSTYLQGLNRKIDEKFHEVYDYIRQSGFANKNGLRIEELETRIQQLEIKLEEMAIENQTLRRILEYSIPQSKVQDAITKLAKEYNIKIMKESGEPMSVKDLVTAIQKLGEKHDNRNPA